MDAPVGNQQRRLPPKQLLNPGTVVVSDEAERTSDLSHLPLPEREAELCATARDRHHSKHRLLHLLAEYDARRGWVLHGATSCTAWWADVWHRAQHRP